MTPIKRAAQWQSSHQRRVGVLVILEMVLLVGFAILPTFLSEYLVEVTARILILGLLALSFDLVWGYAGILSFGQALFFGAAAYVMAVCGRDLDLASGFVMLPLAILVGFVLALLLGRFLLLGRVPPSVIFVALGTLTGSYTGDRLARAWYYLGGQNGIPSFPAMRFGRYEMYSGIEFYYLALVILVLVYLFCRWLVRSQFGLVLAGMRQNEERITFFGYRASTYKATVFAISGAIAGLAGGLLAFHDNFVWPNLLGIDTSTRAVIYVLFGGSGTLIGALLGTTAIEYATFFLADQYPKIWPIVLGLLLLLVIAFRPTGLIGMLVSERERVGRFGRPRQNPSSHEDADCGPT
ncbi:MAG: branched-chain amino acid ABC transporter permease [Candidatus Tectomicrobia bacterium]